MIIILYYIILCTYVIQVYTIDNVRNTMSSFLKLLYLLDRNAVFFTLLSI